MPDTLTRHDTLTREAAEAIAIRAFLSLHVQRHRSGLAAFLARANLHDLDVARAATQPSFMPAVLQFVCEDAERLQAVAADQGITTERILQAALLLGALGPSLGPSAGPAREPA